MPPSATSADTPSQATIGVRVGIIAASCMFTTLIITVLTSSVSFLGWISIISVAITFFPDFPGSSDLLFVAALAGGLIFSAVLVVEVCVEWIFRRWDGGTFNWPDQAEVLMAIHLPWVAAGGYWLLPIMGAFSTPLGLVILRDPAVNASAIVQIVWAAEGVALIPELLLVGFWCMSLWQAYGGRASVRGDARAGVDVV